MIVLLDNYDSFTYNLHDYISRTGAECRVVRNDELTVDQLCALPMEALVISPGPGRPADAGITMAAIARLWQSLPILGICLGFQAIGEHFGASLVHGPVPVHGKTSVVTHQGGPLFEGVQQNFEAMRYHSLVLNQLPDTLQVTAHTADGIPMALQHRQLPLFGLQFHPESILTHSGFQILSNWVQMVTKPASATQPQAPLVF